jgi:D-beta-D-heptose 7-phosphate kinase/D-beta-D-heptose 1-phosphate adenosyltransferase
MTLTRDRLSQLLDRMQGRRVVVLGDAMLDVYLSGDAHRVSPEAPVPVVAVTARRHALGGAGNVAANAAAIGAEGRLVTVIGDDPRGDAVRSEMERHGLRGDHLVVAAARATTSKTRVVARGQLIVRIDEEVDTDIADDTAAELVRHLERAMADADALLIEDYNKGSLTAHVIDRAMTLARTGGVPVVVDPKYRHFFAYRGATVFKPNRRELEQALGAAVDLTHDDALPGALDRLAVDNLLLTLGAEGMVLLTKDREFTRIAAIAREVFDVSGAGDTVTAWVGTVLAAGGSVREAAHVATYAAAVELAKAGVATVAPSEVLDVYDRYVDRLGAMRRGGL